MRAITTRDREHFYRTGAFPVTRRDKIAGTLSALVFLSAPILSPFLPGGIWS